ncbi:MAG: hypothetical protein PHV92_03940 [Candidatus Omnitrophica bacterium]|nr:hypothetical protein [Candidatus Omnitrophota bacterium]
MKTRNAAFKIIIFSAGLLSCVLYFSGRCFALEALETISYNIKPVGSCEYQDFGPLEFRGKKAKLIIFKTDAAGFKDKEVIFSESTLGLPLLVKRDISFLFHKENITEEYFPAENSFKLTKFKGGKKTEEYTVKGKRPIQNAILVPFSLRGEADLKIGSSFEITLPGEYTVRLSSIEDVTVPAGKFKAYHFTSEPKKFEIWISADKLRIPVKIKGLGAFSYTLEMKKRVARQE